MLNIHVHEKHLRCFPDIQGDRLKPLPEKARQPLVEKSQCEQCQQHGVYRMMSKAPFTPSSNAVRRALTRQIKLMLKIVSVHTERVASKSNLFDFRERCVDAR